MSYDIYLKNPPAGASCGRCGGTGKEPDEYENVSVDWNYTSNCAPMWRKAGADLAQFDGKTAGECTPILAAAIEAMESEPEVYRAMDPSNGWGSYDTLLPSLKKLLEGLQQNPHMLVGVWR